MHDPEHNPLVKEVPTHLFAFEERIFGMTLPQVLSDIGAGVGLLALTSSLSLVARVIVCILLAIPVAILVHGKVQGQSFLQWLFLYVRYHFLPKHTVWRSRFHPVSDSSKAAAVQDVWLQIDSLQGGVAGYSEPEAKMASRGRYWVALEMEGRNIRYLAEPEQVRLFGHVERFLAGLEFRVQLLSLTEHIQASDDPALLAQQQALVGVEQRALQITHLQRASLTYQQQHLQRCTVAHHYVVLSASAREEAYRRRHDGTRLGVLGTLFRLLVPRKDAAVTEMQVLELLRIRLSVVQKLFQQLEMRAWQVNDPGMLHLLASCLAPGASLPPFQPRPHVSQKLAPASDSVQGQRGDTSALRQMPIQGLHHTLLLFANSVRTFFKENGQHLADLLAPSSITLSPNVVTIDVRGHKRYLRFFTVRGYSLRLVCGWVSELLELGLPLIISSIFDPLSTPFLIKKLELEQLKLASQEIANRKTETITKADQHVEATQVRRILRLLAERILKILSVSLTIGLHAGSIEHLEERSAYLLSHLRQKQLKITTNTWQQDVVFLQSLPLCAPAALDQTVNLPSDAAATFFPACANSVGTPTGIFLGFVGNGVARRPVYFNPWSTDKKIPNPHVVVVGETGMGKSWLGKTFVTGFMGCNLADVVVLDKDDDYLPLHEVLGDQESQRYDLAQACPINLFALPLAPADVDPDDPTDLLAEFLDNTLITGLALLICDADTRLTKSEEAYLMLVARKTYAQKGFTSESIRLAPNILHHPMPTLADFLAAMQETPASTRAMRQSLLERLDKASYLFQAEATLTLDTPLTIFSIKHLDDKWYPLMTYAVQQALYRHRAFKRDERFLAYIVEEASYMLRHPAGRKYLETGSRGYRKLGIAQFTLSQHPGDFLNEGAVVLANAGTAFFLGMQRTAAQRLELSPELERTITAAIPGQAVMRCGNEYATITIAAVPELRTIFTTDPQERRAIRARMRQAHSASALVHAVDEQRGA